MKKLFSILLVAMLIVTSLATVAFAADSATVSASSVTAKAGDTVTISFTLSGDDFASYGMKITADPILTLTGIQPGAASNGAFVGNTQNGVVGFGATYNCKAGVIFTATFKVAQNAQPGKYPVSVIMDFVADAKQNDLTVSVVSGYVTIECVHSFGQWNTVKEPTCAAAGKAERTCSICGEVESKSLAVTSNHTWGTWQTVKAATCTTEGQKQRTCSVCGKTETATLPVVSHNWSNWKTVVEPTCTTEGKAERTCSVGGEKETKAIAVVAHKWSDWKTVVEPTCTTEGKAERTCSVGGEKQTKSVAVVAHKWSDWKTVVEPTCTTEGKAERTCSVGGEKESKVLPTVSHNWGEWQTVVEPLCGIEGKAERVCSVGGEKETKVLPAVEHAVSEDWIYNESEHWHPCDNGCGMEFGHAAHELKWVITKNPTSTRTGLKHQECTVCGYRGDDVEIPADPDLDDVPPTGDITPVVIAIVVAVLGMLILVAYVIKRQFARNQY